MDLFLAMTVYVKVVETGSMTAAAFQCEMSTTMVGNHLRALEQRLGVRLLNRTTRRQRLTEFGAAYYQRCLEVLGLVADSERLAEQALDEPSGTLRISAPLTFGTEKLAPAMSEFALHARAILGLPIPLIRQFGPSASAVILVEGQSTQTAFANLGAALSEPDTALRLFGKPQVQGQRRMGVALARADSIAAARSKARVRPPGPGPTPLRRLQGCPPSASLRCGARSRCCGLIRPRPPSQLAVLGRTQG